MKEIGCKSAWPVHISPLSWAIERLLPGEIVKIWPRPAEFSLRFFKSDRLLDEVRHSARGFLESLSVELRTLFTRCYCCDADHAMAASRLAKALGLSSYSYRLARLGVTKRQGGAGQAHFGATQLGMWAASLGIGEGLEDRPAMRWLFAQLCHEAQTMDTDFAQ